MRLSRAGDYACRAVLQLSTPSYVQEGQTISKIAREQEIPLPFLRKIIPLLNRAQIVRTLPGRRGGVVLGRPPGEISLREVIEAVEGPVFLNRCLIRPGECSRDKICPIHPVWGIIQSHLMSLLERYTFADFVGEVTSPSPQLKSSRVGPEDGPKGGPPKRKGGSPSERLSALSSWALPSGLSELKGPPRSSPSQKGAHPRSSRPRQGIVSQG